MRQIGNSSAGGTAAGRDFGNRRLPHRRQTLRLAYDLFVFGEAVLVGSLQLTVHIPYYALILNAPPQLEQHTFLALLTGLLFFLLRRFLLRTDRRLIGDWRASFLRSCGVVSVTAAVILALLFLAKLSTDFSRGWMLLWLAGTLVLVAVSDGFVALAIKRREAMARTVFLRHAVVLGTAPLADEAVRLIEDQLAADRHIVAVQTLEGLGKEEAAWNVLRLVREEQVDEIVLALPWSRQEEIAELVERIARVPVAISLHPDRLTPQIAAIITQQGRGSLFLPLICRPMDDWGGIFKRAFDVVLSGLLLVAFSPLLLMIALAIRATSPGPAVFRQRRHGLSNEVFWIWKFRTMRHENGESTFRQASAGDNRVTPLGSFLRRSSLDELPQLLNVLRGEMSLVGPRPHPLPLNVHFASRIPLYVARHRVRPGITGWAQVNGCRGETDTPEKMEERIRLDLEYIRNWSPLLDVKILALTVFKGFVHPNAY